MRRSGGPRRRRGGATSPRRLLACFAGLAAAACSDSPTDSPDMGTVYVALGNSLTAGFRSGGLVDSIQTQSYPALLAERFDLEVVLPLIAPPGCPPPLRSIMDLASAEAVCAARARPEEAATNLAVPGFRTADVLRTRPEQTASPLDDRILPPGRTALEAAVALSPGLVTLWIGSNDVLGATLAGDTTRVTPVTSFEADYAAILAALAATNARVIAATVPDPTVIPALVAGAALWENREILAFLGLEVSASCVGSEALFSLIGWATSGRAVPGAVLDCAADAFVLDPAERSAVRRAVAAFNGIIRTEAAARGFAVVETQPWLDGIRDSIPRFPALLGPEPFGPYFSLDGIHPSARGQRLIAEAFAEAVGAELAARAQR